MYLELTSRYTVSKPRSTHRRPATCEEVNCKTMANGWQVKLNHADARTPGLVRMIENSGRRFTVVRESGVTTYLFESGQRCFRSHSVDLDRPAIYLVRQGARPVRRHANPEDWVDDFSTHLDKLREQ